MTLPNGDGYAGARMSEFDVDRRTILKLIGGCTAAGIAGCTAAEAPREGLVRIFDLAGDEQHWVDVLSPDEQRELYDLLARPEPEGHPQAVRLVSKLLGARSRLFAFVRYPAVLDRRSVCDGLVRE
ncbi:MAG: hypothetical protein ACRD15_00255 [Vicinamibacterales bacterium]